MQSGLPRGQLQAGDSARVVARPGWSVQCPMRVIRPRSRHHRRLSGYRVRCRARAPHVWCHQCIDLSNCPRASCVAAARCYAAPTLRKLLNAETVDWINARDPPKWLWRTVAALVLGGQVLTRVLQGARCDPPAEPIAAPVLWSTSLKIICRLKCAHSCWQLNKHHQLTLTSSQAAICLPKHIRAA